MLKGALLYNHLGLRSINTLSSVVQAKKEASKLRQKQNRAAKQAGQGMSTAVGLDSFQDSAANRLQAEDEPAEQDLLRCAEFTGPAEIKQYMSRQGFTGLTSVQER